MVCSFLEHGCTILRSFSIIAEIKWTTKLQTKVVLIVLYQILPIENDRLEYILIEVLTYFIQSSVMPEGEKHWGDR